MNNINSNFIDVNDSMLLGINGGSTKAIAAGVGIVAGVSGLAAAACNAVGWNDAGAVFTGVAGGACLVAGYCALFPAP